MYWHWDLFRAFICWFYRTPSKSQATAVDAVQLCLVLNDLTKNFSNLGVRIKHKSCGTNELAFWNPFPFLSILILLAGFIVRLVTKLTQELDVPFASESNLKPL